jgi:hypothetical protein
MFHNRGEEIIENYFLSWPVVDGYNAVSKIWTVAPAWLFERIDRL